MPQFDNHPLSITMPTTNNEQMQKIIQYLEKNMGEQHTLKSVSSYFNLSERSMSRLFQSSIQQLFLQLLKTLRMVKAIELILKTKKPISDIAYEVGYLTVSSFSNAFQDFTGTRPSDFRKN